MKKRSSNDIKKIIIAIVLLMVFVLIGLIVFLFSIDIKTNDINIYDENTVEDRGEVQDSSKSITLENYDLIQASNDGSMEVKLSKGKVLFGVEDKDVFKKSFPNSKFDMSKEKEVAVHGNDIQDVFIGKIDKKDYLLVITSNGSIGIMEINEAVNSDVFRIKNSLISFESEVARVERANLNLQNGDLETVVVFTADGTRYDLSDFIE